MRHTIATVSVLLLSAAFAAGCATNRDRVIVNEPAGQKVRTFLMFEGDAEEAMGFYTSLFEDAEVVNITRYGPGEAGPEGSVMQAVFAIRGQEFMCIDSPGKHPFTFTPAISLFVTCETEAEIDRLFGELSRSGSVLMPLDAYPFSRRFAWVNDRFGVSWQLSLPHE